MEGRTSIKISPRDRVIGGVFAAFGRYANVNPNILRAGYLFVAVLYPVQAIAAYGIIFFLAPKDRELME
jgi:phage shock protein PspC (stress-responsive transcriptional regulator)